MGPALEGPVGTRVSGRRAGHQGALLRIAPWFSTPGVRRTLGRSMERKATADGGKRRIWKNAILFFFSFDFFLRRGACFLPTLCAPNVHRMERTSLLDRFRAHAVLFVVGKISLSHSQTIFFRRPPPPQQQQSYPLAAQYQQPYPPPPPPPSHHAPPPPPQAQAPPKRQRTAVGIGSLAMGMDGGGSSGSRGECVLFFLCFLYFNKPRSLPILPLHLPKAHNRGPPSSEAVVRTSFVSFSRLQKRTCCFLFFSLTRVPSNASLVFDATLPSRPQKFEARFTPRHWYRSNQRDL